MRNHSKSAVPRALAAALLAVVTSVGTLAQTSEPTGARSMFYNPATGTLVAPAAKKPAPEPAAVRFVGVHYWLDLDGVGAVSDRHVFYTGQRIRLNIRSNCDGYLSVWALAEGKAALLIPANGDAGGIPLKRGDPFVSASIRFSEPVRDERLLLFFARQKSGLPSFETLQGDAGLAAFRGVGSRDLSIAVEEAAPGDKGTYVVNKTGGPVSREIVLRHSDAAK